MKVLLGYTYYPNEVDVRDRVEAWLARLRLANFEVEGFVVTIDPPSPRLSWQELDNKWRNGDAGLLEVYERLARKAEHFDVFVNCNGCNIHPEFVSSLPTFNVYACFDDPESSDDLSKPVAAAFDLSMVGNIACLDMYRSWGVEQLEWWPIGYHPYDVDLTLTEDQVRNGERAIDVSLLCERVSAWRKERLSLVETAFPQGQFFGRGWPNGFLPEERRITLLTDSKIGINIHNSSGPVNSRTYGLPANGVMQICDNKSHLGHIFELGTEVLGYDSIEEAIDLCRYYLAHDDERRAIAAAGFKRSVKDYNEIAVFKRLIDAVARRMAQNDERKKNSISALGVLDNQRRAGKWNRFIMLLVRPVIRLGKALVNLLSRDRREQ